tara:strand:- start:842 stop:1144 length:303 start_codon:yes stop_codon:yes gene_type:complete
MAKQNKFTKSARGEDCTFRLFPYCNQNPETTVLCHINCDDKGMGIKSPDWWAAYGCSDCHDIIDDRRRIAWPVEFDLSKTSLDAIYRTHKRMIEKGLIKV